MMALLMMIAGREEPAERDHEASLVVKSQSLVDAG